MSKLEKNVTITHKQMNPTQFAVTAEVTTGEKTEKQTKIIDYRIVHGGGKNRKSYTFVKAVSVKPEKETGYTVKAVKFDELEIEAYAVYKK